MGSTIRFPKGLMQRLKSAAARRGFSLNTLLKLAADEWLERHPSQPALTVQQPVPGKVKVAARKVGRNDKCWCGSGRKFKLCHGKAKA